MKRKSRIIIVNVLISLLLIAPAILSQGKNYGLSQKNKELFGRIRVKNLSRDSFGSIVFYPLNDGDFWEYITADTTTLIGQFYDRLNFSITKEITGDTLLTNGIIYKKVKWENIANSVNYPEWYDYHRVDTSGNVYLFYEGSDYLLFDFSLGIGQSYSSHLPNQIWKIADRYEVIGFGDTLQAIDFELHEQGTILKEKYTIVENFGIVYYQQNIDSYLVPEGNFWGAVINGEEYGILIATKQTVDWSDFYPLHIGDYWVYEGQLGSIPTINTVRIISDTLMADGNIYYKSLDIDHTFGYSSFSYRRIDTLGRVYSWEYWNNNSKELFKFSYIVGDTLGSILNYSTFRLNSKGINVISGLPELQNFLFPDLAFVGEDYDLSLGLFYSTGDQTWSELTGALIDNSIWGDTTVTGVFDIDTLTPTEYSMFPCYPNPFNSTSTLTYYLPISSTIEITLYNPIGEKIITLFNGYLPEGYHNQLITAEGLSSGVYLVVLTTTGIQLVNKIIHLK